MVTPVWSGVIMAEKINKHRKANRHFFLQKIGLTIPKELKTSMKIGRRKVIPLVIKIAITQDIKASNAKKVITPSDEANGYINLKVKGII